MKFFHPNHNIEFYSLQQVRDILAHLLFDASRIDAACSLHPAVVDKHNWGIVYSAFDTPASRDKLRKKCGI